jgi:hypothetical protein
MSEQEKEKSAIRPARVIATAMAAVTGAFFASKLGVYGTVVGVGLISLASTVGGELYVRSLDRTKVAAKAASDAALAKAAVVTFAQTSTTREQTVRIDLTTDADVSTEQLTIDGIDDAAATAAIERVDDTQDLDVIPMAEETRAFDGAQPDEADEKLAGWRRIRWPLVAGGTVAAFVLAMIVITGIEALTGNSFSGARGNTIGQLAPNTSVDQPVEESTEPDLGDRSGNRAPVPSEESTPTPSDDSADDSGRQTEPVEPTEPTEPPVEETEPPADEETEPPVDEGADVGGDNSDDDGSGDDDGDLEEPTPRSPGA